MAVKIKLKRMGKIREPYYRIVVADARTKRDGRAIEEIGKYHPKADPSVIEVNSERAQHWLSVGAQPTDPVRKLLEVTGDWQRFKGLPGAEGTLRFAAPRSNKKDAFAAALAETLQDSGATTKGKGRPGGKASDAKAGDAKSADAKGERPSRAKSDKAEKPATAEKAEKPATAEKPARPAKAATAKAETAKAETAKAETAKADAAEAKTAKAETAQAESAKTETAEADDAATAAKADGAKAETKSEGAKAKAAKGDEKAAEGESAEAAAESGSGD